MVSWAKPRAMVNLKNEVRINQGTTLYQPGHKDDKLQSCQEKELTVCSKMQPFNLDF